jgi:hypothetical protein
MAQTTAAVSQSCFKLEINLSATCAAAWLNISGASVNIQGLEQGRAVGEAYTFEGGGPIIKGGKKQPVEAQVSIVYTETDAEAFDQLREYWEASDGCDAIVCLRWSPRGGNAGDQQYQISPAEMLSFRYPTGDAGAGGPVVTGFSVRGSEVATTIVAS